MMWARRIVLSLGMLCAAAAASHAVPTIDINGTYQLTVVDTFDNCTATGTLTVTQSGASFTGLATLTVISAVGCPPSSGSGSVTGTLSGNTIDLGFASGTFGTDTFTGTVSNDGNFLSGTWNSTGDPFGTWSASRAQRASAPALSPWSLAGLALLLGWAGVRRRTARA